MKIRISDRLIVAMAGLVLLALSAMILTATFLNTSWDAIIRQAVDVTTTTGMVIVCAAAAVLLLMGIYCVLMLFRRRKGKRGFVTQNTENGELDISIKALEGLVNKCVAQHSEMKLARVNLLPGKDGLSVDLRITLAGGVSIPLAVGALQKQIRQYITACSGVDVKDVRVQVETTGDEDHSSPYAIPAMLSAPARLPKETEEEAPVEEKPLHQQLFSEEAVTTTPVVAMEEPEAEEPIQESEAAEEQEVAEDTTVESEEIVESTVEEAAEEIPAAEEELIASEAEEADTKPASDLTDETEEAMEDEHENAQ